uniref:Leucine-rich repeat-containing N-terminal plant-type domain-containing protein n=1 Tax=Lactuca sativa TaxID=4236 RepID=A0A9R1V9A6_LACSA|nr:hypothetical protein LSAT_V11C600317720 [Lactuca sativa]
MATTTANQLVAVAVGGVGDDNGVVNKCLDQERHVLLYFKYLLQDPDGRLMTWTAKLDISHCNLGGEISHALHNLSNLYSRSFLQLFSWNHSHFYWFHDSIKIPHPPSQ